MVRKSFNYQEDQDYYDYNLLRYNGDDYNLTLIALIGDDEKDWTTAHFNAIHIDLGDLCCWWLHRPLRGQSFHYLANLNPQRFPATPPLQVGNGGAG